MIDFFLNSIEFEIKDNLKKILSLRNDRTQKEDMSFVTLGDLMINQIIYNQAVLHLEDFVIISEENINQSISDQSGYIIIVDPIDGTENFTSGLPQWGVSVSCYFDGTHQASLLGCPEMNIWIRSGQLYSKYFSRIAALSSSLSIEELAKATQGYEYRVTGCCVYNMINVIRGSFKSFENPKGAKSWDIIGGLNIALENKLEVIVNDEQYKGQYLPADRKYKFRISH